MEQSSTRAGRAVAVGTRHSETPECRRSAHAGRCDGLPGPGLFQRQPVLGDRAVLDIPRPWRVPGKGEGHPFQQRVRPAAQQGAFLDEPEDFSPDTR